ncbi:unnamed protein product, partial [Onchocerca ochengi]|uniref:Uncharacterized protein n=1 Tax=Onchocerca ochengi TaxID=42157 RepID=A0A182EWC6_ONCOC
MLATASQICEADSDGTLSTELIDSILTFLPTDDLSLTSTIDNGKHDNREDNMKESEMIRSNSPENFENTDELCAMTEVLKKLSKKFKGEEIDATVCCDSTDNNKSAEKEIETANCYIDELRNAIPKWLQIKSTIEIDEAIQEFASNFFSGTI